MDNTPRTSPPSPSSVRSARRGTGSTVLTERVDRFLMNGQPIALPVMGTFEVRGGKIAAWRDYFDLADYQRQLAAAAAAGEAA